MIVHASLGENPENLVTTTPHIKQTDTSLWVHDEILGTSDFNGIVIMVARSKLIDVACDGPGDHDCACVGEGEAVCRLTDATVKLGWIGVYRDISVLTVETSGAQYWCASLVVWLPSRLERWFLRPFQLVRTITHL